MIAGQLALGLVEVVGLGTEEEVLGYAYSVECGAGQLQRWLLFSNPQNAFRVRAAPTSMASWTLSDWEENVAELWQPGSYYIRAQTDLYLYGATYGTAPGAHVWTSIPEDADMPAATYPAGGPYQLDPEGGHVMVLQTESTAPGWVYTVQGLDDASNAEYWMLPPEYTPSGGSASMVVTTATQGADDLDEFVAIANQSWGQGCVFAITGCVNYHGQNAPTTL